MKNNQKHSNKDLSNNIIKWKNYINSFEEPKTDIQRMRYHYLCLKKFGWGGSILNTFFAVIAYIPIFIILCLKSICSKKEHVDAILFCTNAKMQKILESDLPQELNNEFPNHIVILKNYGKLRRLLDGMLDKSAIKSILKVFIKYPFAFYMNFYYMVHIAFVCKLKKLYSPKAIISIQTEFDFSTSMLSNYCEKQGIEYIGVAHGEYVLSPERAFVRFSRYYAWSEDMIELFYLTRSPQHGFFIYNTNRLKSCFVKRENPDFFISYYLDDQGYDDIVELKKALVPFADKGLKVKLRIHPRVGDISLTRDIFKDTTIIVEDPHIISLKDSVENSRFIVSTRSTILREAYMSGFDVVIDDISGFIPINILEQVKYDMLKKTNLRLSQLINAV